MAAGGFSYANYLNQNPDDVAAMTGGFPQSAPPAGAPVARADQYAALEEMTRAQQPTPPVQQALAPEQPAFAPVEAPKSRNPRAALREIQGQQVAAANDIGESFIREGEAKAKAAEDRGALASEASKRMNRYAEAAEKNADDNQIMQTEAKKWLRDDMAKLREPPLEKTGWQKASSALTGIVGMIAQGWLGPGAGDGIAYGLNALDNHVNANIRSQLDEKAQAGENIEHTNKYLDTLAKDSNSNLEVAGKLAANHWFATEKELEAIAERAKSPAEKEAALRLAKDANLKGLNIYEGMTRETLAEQRAAAAARAKALGAGPDWKNMDPSVLEALEREGKLPLAGLDALNDSRKRANDANPKPNAEVAAKLVAPEGREVTNPDLWSATPDTEKVKYRASQAALDKYNRNSNRLQALLEKHGTQAFGEGAGEMDSLSKSLALDIKDITDAGALDEGLINVVNSMHGDPNAIFTSGGNVLERLRTAQAQLNSGQEAKAMQLGLGARRETRGTPIEPGAPAASQPRQAPQAPAAPKAPATVRMVRDSDGKVLNVPADRVPAARNSGFRLPDELGKTEANAPLAADDAESARIQQALASIGG